MIMPAAVALVPLDERPVCTGLPAMIAAVAGVALRLPPVELLPDRRTPGRPDALADWLRAVAPDVHAAVVSLEGHGFGGLIASRIGDENELEVAARWEVLRDLGMPVHAFGVALRTPDADDPGEEPDYFATYGRALHARSAALHDHRPGAGEVPDEVAADFFGRRLRNHLLNLRALRLAARQVEDRPGALTSIVLMTDGETNRGISAGQFRRYYRGLPARPDLHRQVRSG